MSGSNCKQKSVRTRVCIATAVILVTMLMEGCTGSAATTQPMSEDQKQDAILNDPMNYKPNINRDVTGDDGNSTHLGRGFGSDVNDLLNP